MDFCVQKYQIQHSALRSSTRKRQNQNPSKQFNNNNNFFLLFNTFYLPTRCPGPQLFMLCTAVAFAGYLVDAAAALLFVDSTGCRDSTDD